MEVTYKKDISHTYILFHGDHSEEKVNTETFQVQMVLHNLVEGLLPCSIMRMDADEVWRCECTNLQSLEELCKRRELGKDDFIWIINQILENIQELQDFLLDVNSLYLMPGEIYIHPEKMRLLCCMVPFYHNDIWGSLKQVLQFLLQYLDPQDNEVASMAYGFFRALSKEDCSMELLWSLLYEKQRKWKINTADEKEKWSFGLSEGNKLPEHEPVLWNMKEKKVERKEIEKPAGVNERKSYAIQDEVDERDALLDELFFKGKENQDMESDEQPWKNWISKDFLKKILYLFPAVAAIFLFLYLVFNSWTMSGIKLAVFAVIIVLLQVLSLIFYRKWGRDIEEVNPLLELEASKSGKEILPTKRSEKISEEFSMDFTEKRLWDLRRKDSEGSEEGTAYLEAAPNKKSYLVRSDTGERYELSNKEMVIGKNKERAQILLTEPTVSRIHAIITKTGNSWYIQDLNSKNGTYLNGARLPIRTDTLVQESDELYVANIPFHLEL